MLNTIQMSVLKELAYTFVLSTVALNFILMMEKVVRMTKYFSSMGASVADMLVIILYIQPQIAVFTFPLSLLVSVLITYGRMNMDSELVVLRSSGMSFPSLSKPVFAFGAFCFAFSLFSTLYLSPAAAVGLRGFISRVISERAPYAIEEGVFSSVFGNRVLYASSKPSKDTVGGLFIYEEKEWPEVWVLTAEEGRILGSVGEGVGLSLRNGSLDIVGKDTVTRIAFGRYDLEIPVDVTGQSVKRGQLSIHGLLEKIGTEQDPGERTRFWLELHGRASLPLLCLIFSVLGPPLALMSGRSGRLVGFIIGMAVFASYYALRLYSENLAVTGTLPHYAGAWLPSLVFTGAAVFMFRRAMRT